MKQEIKEEREVKTININNTIIEYTHMYATHPALYKFNFRERLRLLFGNPLLINLNIYLKDKMVVYTVANLQTLRKTVKEQQSQIINNLKKNNEQTKKS